MRYLPESIIPIPNTATLDTLYLGALDPEDHYETDLLSPLSLEGTFWRPTLPVARRTCLKPYIPEEPYRAASKRLWVDITLV